VSQLKPETIEFYRGEIRRTLDRPRQRAAHENLNELSDLRGAHRFTPSVTVAGLTPEQRVKFDQLLARYLANARRQGKRTHGPYRQPYLMNALRYATHTPEQLEESMDKTRKGTGKYYRRMRRYYGDMKRKFAAKQEKVEVKSRVKWNAI
jgi:hypothetical protein